MVEPLADRSVVVTGGTGALGEVVVAPQMRAGAICHVPSHSAGGAVSDSKNDRLRIVPRVELTDEAAVEGFYASLPGLWASVHLAGGFAMSPLVETSRADFLHMIEKNTLSAFLCCRAAARAMRKAGHGGRIVNVAARPGIDPRKGVKRRSKGTPDRRRRGTPFSDNMMLVC